MKKTIKINNKNNTKFIAHRGLSGIEIENTMPAFLLACQHDYFGIETDVHRTKDGVFILHHDDDLKRIYNLDLLIKEHDAKTLIEATKNIGEAYHLVKLHDFLNLCEKYDKVAFVEIKTIFTKQDIRDLLEACLPYMHRIIFISFFYDALVLLRECGYKGEMSFLSWSPIDETFYQKLSAINAGADIQHHLATKEVIERFHALGLKVNVWTLLEEKERAITLIHDGVDYITTDILE